MGSASSKSHGISSSRRRKNLGESQRKTQSVDNIALSASQLRRISKHDSRPAHHSQQLTSATSRNSSISSHNSLNICSQIGSQNHAYGSRVSLNSDLCSSNNNNKNASPRIPLPIQLGFQRTDFKVSELKVTIDKKVTTLDERSAAVLKYRTPHFRAEASVEIPSLPDKQSIRVGWIQTCTSMRFINTYGFEGVTSWEFPEIVSGKCSMISDADGKQYPWYGSKHEVHTVSGPSSRHIVKIHMNDNFFPQVTWYIPHSNYDRTPRLTNIHRKQDFLTYLVVKDLNCDTYHVLKTIKWSMNINVEVNPELPLGRRAKLLAPLRQSPPEILDENKAPSPAPQALRPPNANNSQVLVWRPLEGDSQVVVPPVQTTVDLDSYVVQTRDHINLLKHHIPEL